MNFCQKKDKILSLHVKDKYRNILEAQQLYQKRTPTQVFSCEYSERFMDGFFIEQLRWLLSD